MINTVTVINEFEESITITLGDTEPSTGLFITEIEGLGPPKADISMNDIATMDGSIFQRARGKQRDITFHFLHIAIGGMTVEDSRLLTYKYFPLKKKVTIIFETENRSAKAVGYVEENEPEIFTEEAGTKITVRCESPWLTKYGPDGSQDIIFSDINPEFEFEFQDYQETSPSIVFSSIEVKRENIIRYKGEADSGIIMSIYGYDRFRFPTIYNNTTREKITINTDKVEALIGSNIRAGDEIRISTYQNDKYIHFIREGVTTNILNALAKDADWFTIHPGDNIFSYTCTQGELDVVFMISVDILLQGV